MTVEPSPAAAKRWFVPALLVGWALIAWGVWSALRNGDEAEPVSVAVRVIALDIAHDVVFAPLLFIGAWLVSRVIPEPARGPVRAAAVTSLLVVLFSIPLLRRWGQHPTNSSTLPLDYERNVAVILIAIWAVAAASVAVRVVRARRA